MQAFELEYVDQLKVIPERKVLIMAQKILDAIRDTIRKEGPALLNSDEHTRDWTNQPEPPLKISSGRKNVSEGSEGLWNDST